MKSGWCVGKHLSMACYKLSCRKLSAEQHSTIVVTPSLLDIWVLSKCTMAYNFNFSGHIWPQTSTATCRNVSHSVGIGFLKTPTVDAVIPPEWTPRIRGYRRTGLLGKKKARKPFGSREDRPIQQAHKFHPNSKVTAPLVAIVFLANRIILYEIPSIVLTDNSPQFVSNFFALLGTLLKTRLVTTTEYHP